MCNSVHSFALSALGSGAPLDTRLQKAVAEALRCSCGQRVLSSDPDLRVQVAAQGLLTPSRIRQVLLKGVRA